MSDPSSPVSGRIAAPEGGRDDAPTARNVTDPAPAAGVSRRLLAVTFLVLALIVAAVWLDGRHSRQVLRGEIAGRLGQIDASLQAADRSRGLMASDLRDAQAKIALLEARLAESQDQQAALEALYRDLAPSRDDIALTEIEQIVLVATQQLQLAGNVSSALAALQVADAKVQRLDRPQFLPLRRALSRDIDRLKAVPFVDVAGISLKLDQALAGVDALPMAMDERLPAPPPEPGAARADTPAWRRLLGELWGELRQLIRIEVADRPAAPLVPPPQQYFLRENLKLRLLSARIGLLSRNDESFKTDIAAAEHWLRQYFDTRARPVQTLLATLKQLHATPMAIQVPDLARTLEAVRVLRLAAERSPGRPPGADRLPR